MVDLNSKNLDELNCNETDKTSILNWMAETDKTSILNWKAARKEQIAARKERSSKHDDRDVEPPVSLLPPLPPSTPAQVDSLSESHGKDGGEAAGSPPTKKRKTVSAPSLPAGHEGADTDMEGTPVASPSSWTSQVGADTDMVEGPGPSPPAIETVDMTFVMTAIDIGDGNESTPQLLSQVAARLSTILEGYYKGSGMALGEKIMTLLHYKNRNKAGQRNSTDEKKRVRTASEGFLILMDSDKKKISWFPGDNNKKCGVLMVTGSHYREKGTNKSFAQDETTVWSQVTCSAHQSPGSSTH